MAGRVALVRGGESAALPKTKMYYPGDVELGYPKAYQPSPTDAYPPITEPCPEAVEPDPCFNIQWMLFIIGFLFAPCFMVACFLPLCKGRGPSGGSRFPSRCYKSGWIANIVLSIVSIAWMTTVIVIASQRLY